MGLRPRRAGHAQIAMGHFRRPVPDVRTWVPDAPSFLQDLIVRLCAKKAEERPTAAEAIEAVAKAEARLRQPKATPDGAVPRDALPPPINGWVAARLLGEEDLGPVFVAERAPLFGRQLVIVLMLSMFSRFCVSPFA